MLGSLTEVTARRACANGTGLHSNDLRFLPPQGRQADPRRATSPRSGTSSSRSVRVWLLRPGLRQHAGGVRDRPGFERSLVAKRTTYLPLFFVRRNLRCEAQTRLGAALLALSLTGAAPEQ